MNKKEYQQYLTSPGWKTRRRASLHRAANQCERCEMPGTQAQLDVHHYTYERVGNERETDLIVLCRSCHLEEHGIEASFTYGWETIALHNATMEKRAKKRDGIIRVLSQQEAA